MICLFFCSYQGFKARFSRQDKAWMCSLTLGFLVLLIGNMRAGTALTFKNAYGDRLYKKGLTDEDFKDFKKLMGLVYKG
jgi:hypothetical protein